MSYTPSFGRDKHGNFDPKKAFAAIIGGSDAYLLEDELNEMQWIQNESRADFIRQLIPSGVLNLNTKKMSIAGFDKNDTVNIGVVRVPSATDMSNYLTETVINSFQMTKSIFNVNGYLVNVTNNGYIGDFATNLITLSNPPNSGTREDLVFLEVWFAEVNSQGNVYKHGGAGNDKLSNDLKDARINAETARRAQLRWAIRTVADVDFLAHPKGVTDQNVVRPQGDNLIPISTLLYTQHPTDAGLYVAGHGDNDIAALKSIDGYMYAIPLFRVTRRNINPFNNILNQFGGKSYTNSTMSDRPDGLFNNIISENDIIDLRHNVSLSNLNHEYITENNFNNLLRNELKNKSKNKLIRNYIGGRKLSSDVNTKLFVDFDSPSINGVFGAGYTNITGTKVGAGNITYKPGVIKTGAYFSNYGVKYTVALTNSAGSIELALKPDWFGTEAGNARTVISAYNSSNVKIWSIEKNPNNKQLRWIVDGIGDIVYSNIDTWKSNEWHTILLTWISGGQATLYLDNVQMNQSNSPAFGAVSYVVIGSDKDGNTSFNGVIDEVRISDIGSRLTNNSILPTNFNRSEGDILLDGPDEAISFWSDDNATPNGLSHVPNQIIAYAEYPLGSALRHYAVTSNYSNGLTGGWLGNVDLHAGEQNVPANRFGISCEYTLINANESTSSSISTFTFNKPGGTPESAQFLLNQANADVCVLVNDIPANVNTLAIHPTTGVVTAVLTSAAPAGSTVKLQYTIGQNHIHLVPQTKGFVIHNWKKEVFANSYINNPGVAPTLTSATGGSLTAGTTYYVRYTYTTAFGETMAGASTSHTVAASNNAINVSIGTLPVGATGYKVYMSTTSGSEKLAGTVTGNAVYKITNVPAGAALPISNTAQVSRTFTLATSNTVNVINHVRLGNTIYSDGTNVYTIAGDKKSITFTTNFPSSYAVEIIYEESDVIGLGSTAFVQYQYVPYQGLIKDNKADIPVEVMYMRNGMFITTYGTGGGSGSVGSFTDPITWKLPLGAKNVDNIFKRDVLGFSKASVSGPINDFKTGITYSPILHANSTTGDSGLEYLTTVMYSESINRGGTLLPISRVQTFDSDNNVQRLVLNVSLVKALTTTIGADRGELLLMITSIVTNTTGNFIDDNLSPSTDLYRLNGRPLVK